jgi:hypothetical protein
MPKRIPLSVAREVAKKTNCRQVIIMAWDGELTHVVTYGKSLEDCDQAAIGGNLVKERLGWPESECNAMPSRVQKLQEENEALRVKHMKLRSDLAALGVDIRELRKFLGMESA